MVSNYIQWQNAVFESAPRKQAPPGTDPDTSCSASAARTIWEWNSLGPNNVHTGRPSKLVSMADSWTTVATRPLIALLHLGEVSGTLLPQGSRPTRNKTLWRSLRPHDLMIGFPPGRISTRCPGVHIPCPLLRGGVACMAQMHNH